MAESSSLLRISGEEIDATMAPVLARAIHQKGGNLDLRFGGEEVECDHKLQLYQQAKLSDPHYKPEMGAQCTLIHFMLGSRAVRGGHSGRARSNKASACLPYPRGPLC